MSASQNDLVRNATPNFATTLNGSLTNSSTTAVLQSISGLPTGTGVTLVIDATDNDGNPTPAVKEVVTGVVNTGSISVVNCLRGLDGTTAQSHATGANVVMWITANLWNDFQTAFLAEHNQLTGTHGAITPTSITLDGNFNQTAGTFTVQNGTISTSSLNNPCKFFVYLGSLQTIDGNSEERVAFDTTIDDTGSNVDITGNKGRFTASINGFYKFEAQVSCAAYSGEILLVDLYKNGSQLIRGDQNITTTEESYSLGVTSPALQLNSGDYIEVYVYQSETSGMGLNYSGPPYVTWFGGELVSEI